MTKDHMFTRRRLLMAGAAVVGTSGAAGAAALLGGESTPVGPGPTPAPGGTPAAGSQTGGGVKPSAYRLQPLTGYGPPRAHIRTLVRSEPFLRVAGMGRAMVLTFDDGPDPRYTPAILRTLREYDVRAMFFVCGAMAADHKDLLREMADDGHVVGNHTWSHPLLPGMSRSAIRAQMESTSEVIEEAYGEAPRWFRAPYGAWNRAVFRIGAELGMEPLGWTLDTLDWRSPGTRSIVERVEDHADAGVVVLSHDAGGNRSQSVRALRHYLPALLDEGYQIAVPRRKLA
ncbi:polysaccharide deacetylase family protein [Streptomyces spongiae]|uniref:Polysaccharide deacetylase family protein n=1 Tax=Streptomyces spongiae TaxID=565072 RepID=A0A5N8XEW6_9ACTN|nr:polysaccharide deacetylase family protein [Streptomyces spongiae]MPY57979.1 polysaccharide deacetylase family protein [Streptomyces spongiae]